MKKLVIHLSKELENTCKLAKKLDNDTYFELTKEEIINYFELVNSGISKWKEYLDSNKINLIVDDYKKYESIISELELCLLDYDEEFNIRDISCTYFKLGDKLVLYQKEVDMNE